MRAQKNLVFLLVLSGLLNIFLLTYLLRGPISAEIDKLEGQHLAVTQPLDSSSKDAPQMVAPPMVAPQMVAPPALTPRSDYSAKQSSSEILLQPATTQQREALFNQGRKWLTEDNFEALELFLRDYLQQHPLDMDFLLLEAELIVQTDLLSDAIAHYYSLKKLPMTGAQNQLIDEKIKALSAQTIAQLQKAYSWDNLAIFVEPLLQLEPENRGYILALAEAYAQQQQINLMENVLAALTYDDPSAMRIRQLTLIAQSDEARETGDPRESTQDKVQHGTAIQLQQWGDQYVVHGQLSGNNIALLIDTGASITAISKSYFEDLSNRFNINFIGRFNVNTAGGKVLAPMYQFTQLKLNHAVVKDISVMVLPMNNMDNINGLLGMNFLREFDFKIDQRQALLLLKP